MNPRVQDVRPLPDYQLELLFTNRERKVFDARPYLTKGIFSVLQDTAIFNQVQPFNGTITWPEYLDLDPDTLYLDSNPYPEAKNRTGEKHGDASEWQREIRSWDQILNSWEE